MARSNIKAVFENDVQTVWNVITDVKNYIWRTDLSKTEIISDKQFIEYTKTKNKNKRGNNDLGFNEGKLKSLKQESSLSNMFTDQEGGMLDYYDITSVR